MKSLRINAHGKLNLFLKVLRKRPDHYHDIYSLFHKVKLADELVFRPIPAAVCRIVSESKDIPPGPENLIGKAYELLRDMTGLRRGVEVEVKKRIPVGGGMGGGSSDAASALTALNRLFSLGLRDRDLLLLGLRLGADVPFFLSKAGSALVGGVGERIEPYGRVGRFRFLLVLFPEGLSTRSVYEGLRLTPRKTGVTIKPFSSEITTVDKLKRILVNDLMSVSFELYPLVKKVHRFISGRKFAVSQTGSGPTLFTAGPSKGALLELGDEIEKMFNLKTQLTETL